MSDFPRITLFLLGFFIALFLVKFGVIDPTVVGCK